MELVYGDNETAQIEDAVKVAALALEKMVTSGRSITSPPKSCNETKGWTSGLDVFK
jgi:hypothetical protein